MTNWRRLIALLLLCSVTMAGVGCTSMKTLRPNTSPQGRSTFDTIKVGYTVFVRIREGRTATFDVRQVDEDTLVALRIFCVLSARRPPAAAPPGS
jgi:hypothetical protein